MTFSNAVSHYRVPFRQNPLLITLTLAFFVLWASTLIGTTDLANWFLENTLVFITIGAMILTYRRMKFSDLSYLLFFVYICLHVYGAKYTYAENPLGYWLMEVLHTERNHYDRIVHFCFGLLLAYPMRELFLVGLRYPAWVAWLLPIELTMSFSALYELVEWGVADLLFPAQGMAYLGTQGDIWDAQKDIALAFSGAIVATTLVSIVKRRFRIE